MPEESPPWHQTPGDLHDIRRDMFHICDHREVPFCISFLMLRCSVDFEESPHEARQGILPREIIVELSQMRLVLALRLVSQRP